MVHYENKNIIDLLKIVSYISNHEHLLSMNAKFHSSVIDIEHDISLTDMSAAPQKSYG